MPGWKASSNRVMPRWMPFISSWVLFGVLAVVLLVTLVVVVFAEAAVRRRRA